MQNDLSFMPLEMILIDDDEIDCESIKRQLKKLTPVPVWHIFHEGLKALEFITNNLLSKPNTKYLIILDINMPSFNGFQVLSKLNALKNDGRFEVCICTTSSSALDKDRALSMGILKEHYFLKHDFDSNQGLLDYIKKKIAFSMYLRHSRKLENNLSASL